MLKKTYDRSIKAMGAFPAWSGRLSGYPGELKGSELELVSAGMQGYEKKPKPEKQEKGAEATVAAPNEAIAP